MSNSKSYSDVIRIETFIGRFEYLRSRSTIGDETFGSNRFFNQRFYRSYEWQKLRRSISIRDNGCDLAHHDYPIQGKIVVHHIIPVSFEDLVDRNQLAIDPDNLILVSELTHRALHFGDASMIPRDPVIRFPRDTKLW